MKLKIFRSGNGGSDTHYDVFTLPERPGLSVLSALAEIKQQFDETLTFRYSCRGAVCGTCGMLINKVPRLACRTQVSSLFHETGQAGLAPFPEQHNAVPWDPQSEVLLEPLPNLPVIRDLVVDMSEFFRHYRLLGPVFIPAGPAPDNERPMDPTAVKELEVYTNCILCAACFSACPVSAENPRYPGPAALAKIYRFHIDPRESRDGSRLLSADSPDGWWACRFYSNCAKVCPKSVTPNVAIGKARKELSSLPGHREPERE
ncbi:MAG TPA: succinate dehydrogenase/fumarate reductase iron-sulfur subunit [Methanoregulaceae archaeon]|nr:succinate dehydrogenase/fumarate reductase iron-sulfur subunit [Methanoregulaceae archaeon]